MNITLRTLIDGYAAYDHWANARILERVMREDAAILDAPLKSSFPSLRTTFMHIRNAEAVWNARLRGEAPQWPAEQSEDMSTFLPYIKALREVVRGMEEADLLGTMQYKDLKGNPWQQTRLSALMHVFNHSTYHRGQIITMLRELDRTDIPALDLVVFQRLDPSEQAKW